MNLINNSFDKNNIDRIKALMKVKEFALQYHLGLSNFFSTFSAIVDIPLSYLINDELTNVSNRFNLEKLLSECKLNEDVDITCSVMDMKDLFVNRADQIIGSLLLDFNVSAFSSFEFHMCEVYDFIKPHFETKNAKKKKLIKLINKYNENNDDKILDEIMGSCSNYVSSAEKIQFVLSKVEKGYSKYKTYKQDLVLIDFLSKRRNTIHNCGIHKGKTQEWKYKNKIYKLEFNKGYFSENYSEDIMLWLDVLILFTYVFVYVMENFEEPNRHLCLNKPDLT